MKPIELTGNCPYYYGYAGAVRIFNDYKNDDCVVAYKNCFLGTLMVVRGARGYYGFLFKNKESNLNNNDSIHRVDLSKTLKMLNIKDENKIIILNQDLYNKFERTVVFDSLSNK